MCELVYKSKVGPVVLLRRLQHQGTLNDATSEQWAAFRLLIRLPPSMTALRKLFKLDGPGRLEALTAIYDLREHPNFRGVVSAYLLSL